MKWKNFVVAMVAFATCGGYCGTYCYYGYTAEANGYTWLYNITTGGSARIDGADIGSDDWDYVSTFYWGKKPSGCVEIPSYLDGLLVTEIAYEAFRTDHLECDEITAIKIPAGVKWISSDAIFPTDCPKLSSIIVDSQNNYYTSIDGVLYDKLVTRIDRFPPAKKASLEIPSSVTSIGDRAFYGCSCLTGVTIPSSVTSIGNYAFEDCSGLKSIAIPSSVTSIGGSAFYGCSGLTSVTIPEGVTAIYSDTFRGCSGLTSVTIPSSATIMGDRVFEKCTGITSVVMPGNFVLSSLFPGSHNIQRLEIASGSTSVCVGFANGRSSLTSIIIPDSVTSIGRNAFYGCSCLGSGIVTVNGCMFCVSDSDRTVLEIGADIINISDDVWEHCPYLKTITVHPDNTHYKIIDGILYTVDGKTLVASPKDVESVTIPAEVTTIGEVAFYGCAGIRSAILTPNKPLMEIFPSSYWAITNVVIHPGSAVVCKNACSGCANLMSVTIPESVTKIDESAFDGCSSLSRVDISNLSKWYGVVFGNATANPLYYGKHLFLNGSEITALNVPSDVSSIADYVFYNASLIESVTIPASVTSIGVNAFTGCSGIRTIDIPSSYNVATVFPDAYSAITQITIPEGTTSIAENAYKGCASVTVIEMPASVTNIGVSAFEGCSALSRVDISDLTKWWGMSFGNSTANPLYYGKHLFINGNEITVLSAPAGVSSIADYAFYNATSIESVTIPSSVTNIGANAFTGCTGIRTIDIPASCNVATVFPDAYDAVTKLIIPDGTTTIAANAYRGCSSVAAVEVPASVTTIGSSAFQDCSSLKSVTFKGQAPACGDNVFTGTSADMVVYAGTGTSGWTQWNGRPLAFVDAGGGSEEPEKVEKAMLTVTNVVIHYVVNSVVPEKAYPAIYDTGFVNIITEVKSGGAVSVPATWMVNYPDYVSKFGGDFTKSLMKPTGKYDAANNPMFVWQDYVAGTDPTDEEDVFKASITMDENGNIVVSYTPELSDEEKSKRQYTTYGKKSLTDKDWVVVPSGSEADYNFFKVTVEMK